MKTIVEALQDLYVALGGKKADVSGLKLNPDVIEQIAALVNEGALNELPALTGNAGKFLKVDSDAEGVEWAEAGGGGGGLTLYGPYFARNNSQYSVGTSGEYIPLDKIYDSNDNEVSGNNAALYLMQSYNVSISGINTQSAGPYSVYVTSITGSSVTVGQFDCSVGFYSTVELQPAG